MEEQVVATFKKKRVNKKQEEQKVKVEKLAHVLEHAQEQKEEKLELKGTKYLWKIPVADHVKILEIATAYALSLPVSQVLISRGFKTREQIDSFLFSSYEQDVGDMALMKDGQKAVDRILLAIERQEKILIFGDYDVDGITSSSLMMACLAPLGAQVNFYLPHRIKDGYGLSTKIVERAADNNYKIIITVDNGTTAFEPARVARDRGIDLLITDHHKPQGTLPDAYALVNPHQEGCAYPFKEFAGVGVTFKVLSLLYQKLGKKLPEKAYELLLLGTVADVVPLLGENRFWVREALHYVHEHESFSLQVLKTNGKCTSEKLTSTDIGFRIAPQINALGRLEDPRQGVMFLLGTDTQETTRIGTVLVRLNDVRKEIERKIFEDVTYLITSGQIDLSHEKIIVAASAEWPPGVIGLVASRIVSEYGRPTILLHKTSGGKVKGSCRSIDAFSIFDALQENADLLDQFGGHAVAAGLMLDQDKVSLLKERLEARASRLLTEKDLQKTILCDAHLSLTDVGSKLLHDLHYLEPFGAQNHTPVFYLKNISLVQTPQLLKDQHVKCMISAEGVVKPLLFFNRPDLYDLLLAQAEEPFDVVVQVTENRWQGRVTYELLGIDTAQLKKQNCAA